jgi:hypothetical protein
LEYLEEYDLDISRAAVLEELGRYKEAGDIHLAEGRILEAIQLFLMNNDDQYTVRRGHACILQGLWRHLSFAVKVQDGGAEATKLLNLASKVKLTSTDIVVNDEVCPCLQSTSTVNQRNSAGHVPCYRIV